MSSRFDNALISIDYLLQNNHYMLNFISNNMFMSSQAKIFFS